VSASLYTFLLCFACSAHTSRINLHSLASPFFSFAFLLLLVAFIWIHEKPLAICKQVEILKKILLPW
jgi:hypothetical protein